MLTSKGINFIRLQNTMNLFQFEKKANTKPISTLLQGYMQLHKGVSPHADVSFFLFKNLDFLPQMLNLTYNNDKTYLKGKYGAGKWLESGSIDLDSSLVGVLICSRPLTTQGCV